jgi:hypothetical protein
MIENEVGQRRAKAGGEFGANGEWYEGGKFIATTDRAKQAPAERHEMSPEDRARMDEEHQRQAELNARYVAWLSGRREKFARLIETLNMRDPGALYETFHQSLGRQLEADGCLSPKQARCAVSFFFGRENKQNSEARGEMLDSLPERLA